MVRFKLKSRGLIISGYALEQCAIELEARFPTGFAVPCNWECGAIIEDSEYAEILSERSFDKSHVCRLSNNELTKFLGTCGYYFLWLTIAVLDHEPSPDEVEKLVSEHGDIFGDSSCPMALDNSIVEISTNDDSEIVLQIRDLELAKALPPIIIQYGSLTNESPLG